MENYDVDPSWPKKNIFLRLRSMRILTLCSTTAILECPFSVYKTVLIKRCIWSNASVNEFQSLKLKCSLFPVRIGACFNKDKAVQKVTLAKPCTNTIRLFNQSLTSFRVMAHAQKKLALCEIPSHWNQGDIKLAVGLVQCEEACHPDCLELMDGWPLTRWFICIGMVLMDHRWMRQIHYTWRLRT